MQPPRTLEADGRHRPPEHELNVCPKCSSQLVELVATRRFDERWRHVERRCPECPWTGADLVNEAALARFGEQLDAGRAALAALLDEMQRSRLRSDVERFAQALDHVLPEDF
jgi:hypothetical protein